MTEANASVHQARLHASMGIAVNVRARQMALNVAKDQLRAQGLRVSQFSHRELVIKADQYLAQHREELITDAKADVERCRRRGSSASVQNF